MGTEELTIEEGQTEPPICGFKKPPSIYGVPYHRSRGASTLELDSDKDTVFTKATLTADEFHADSAHVFPVEQTCGCLNTDIK